MSRKSRNKGKVGEREAAHEIARILRCEARRGVQFQGGKDSPDVQHSIHGIHFEVKRTEKLSLYTAMAQAIADAQENIPVVLHRPNNKPWLAVVRLDDLPALAYKLFYHLNENPQ